jgi:tetratricopeptide (TPR) repeat protein
MDPVTRAASGVLALLLALSSPAGADIVHLRNGGKVEGAVRDLGSTLEVRTATGTLTLPKDQVLRIERKPFEIPATETPRPTRLGGSFSHPFLGLKLQLPRHWTRGKEHGQASLSFYGPQDGPYRPRMDLFIQTSSKDLVDFVKSYKDAFRKGAQNAEFERERAVAIRERQGYRFVVAFEEAEFPIRQQAIFTFLSDGDRKYVLSFNCSAAWYGRYRESIEASMGTLRLHVPPPLEARERQEFLLNYQAGERAYREGRLDEALEAFTRASTVLPGFPDVHVAVGTILLKQGRLAEAEPAFRKAVEIDPQDLDAAYNFGLCLLKARKLDPAIGMLQRACDLDPHSEPARTNLGAAYLSKELNDLALEALLEAVRLDPESAPAHYNLGVTYERLDRKKDAAHEYKQALSADPKHAEARKALERLEVR